MAQCPQCQRDIPEGNTACNYCGYQLQQVKQTNPSQVKFLIAILVFISFAGFIVSMILSMSNQVKKIAIEKGTLNIECVNSSGCELPMEYAVQSNCPYQAFCQDYQCVVGCPMWEHSDDPNALPISYNVKCETAADCDCTIWDSENKYKCACLDSQCAAVIEEIKK